jgi:hypothetical protein
VWIAPALSDALFTERNFYGVVSVRQRLRSNGLFHELVHGSTRHGLQRMDPEYRREPLSYFTRGGPVGQVFEVYNERPASPNVGVTGLGAGALACYARPDQEWTFYEIDPAVERVARDPTYFTYLHDCTARGGPLVILGDARLHLAEAPEGHFGLLVLDAFSSDAVPTHLLTREAFRLYRSRLAPGGLIAVNISNRYLDIAPVLGDLAADARLACYHRPDFEVTKEEQDNGKAPSHWVVLAASEADLGRLAHDPRWQQLGGGSGGRLWTDDYSNLFRQLRRP